MNDNRQLKQNKKKRKKSKVVIVFEEKKKLNCSNITRKDRHQFQN